MTLVVRIGLAVLAAVELTIGAWNQFWPAHFYANFPTVSLTPPYSEHFARDFGGATLGIAAVLVIALVRPTPQLVGIAALAYSVFSVPHFVFHTLHLEHATAGEVVFLEVANGIVALIGFLLLGWSGIRLQRDRRRLRDPAVG